jgi:hypothetical protein
MEQLKRALQDVNVAIRQNFPAANGWMMLTVCSNLLAKCSGSTIATMTQIIREKE